MRKAAASGGSLGSSARKAACSGWAVEGLNERVGAIMGATSWETAPTQGAVVWGNTNRPRNARRLPKPSRQGLDKAILILYFDPQSSFYLALGGPARRLQATMTCLRAAALHVLGRSGAGRRHSRRRGQPERESFRVGIGDLVR